MNSVKLYPLTLCGIVPCKYENVIVPIAEIILEPHAYCNNAVGDTKI